jgi:hypothetical protein
MNNDPTDISLFIHVLLNIPDHGSRRVSFGSGHVGLPSRKSWPAPDPSHVWVGSGFGFLVTIFGLSWVIF